MYNKNYTRKNMYKLVAIDLDGTLLNSYGEVSEKNKKAIKKAMQNGKEIVIASGRPLQSAKSFALESGASNYVTCGNGSLLYDVRNDKILFDKFIPSGNVMFLLSKNMIFVNAI